MFVDVELHIGYTVVGLTLQRRQDALARSHHRLVFPGIEKIWLI
jgi:hypothetical protein